MPISTDRAASHTRSQHAQSSAAQNAPAKPPRTNAVLNPFQPQAAPRSKPQHSAMNPLIPKGANPGASPQRFNGLPHGGQHALHARVEIALERQPCRALVTPAAQRTQKRRHIDRAA